MSPKALREFIAKAMEKGYYRESFHASNDHPERNISIDDVIHGLESTDWRLAKPPVFEEAYGDRKYLIKTKDVEGDELHIVVAAIVVDGRIEVITRW